MIMDIKNKLQTTRFEVELYDAKDYDREETNDILVRWNFSLLALYVILLAAVSYNAIKFLCIQKRYRNL